MDEIRPRLEPDLRRRELQVLFLIALGSTDAQIGLQLGISIRTVRFHWERIRSALCAKNKPHAVAIAMQKRLIDLDKFG